MDNLNHDTFTTFGSVETGSDECLHQYGNNFQSMPSFATSCFVILYVSK